MKITNISCEQFAGTLGRNVSFTDGINVVYGKNESGKSTLVNLISRTLFQKSKIDNRTDKDFRNLYFPTSKKGSTFIADSVDGRITFETEKGTFVLSKEWGADSHCKLTTPDGIIRDQNSIDEILKESLVYGEGVYSDFLLSSQRNTDISLQTILDASKKNDAKQEIIDAVSQAFAESDGISADAIEQAITAKIDAVAGAHWDFEREIPQRKAGGDRHKKQLGTILESYYALEDAQNILDEISRLETEVERVTNDFTHKENELLAAEEAYNKFNTFANRLTIQSDRKKAIERIDKDLLKFAEVLANWPKLSENLEKAKTLQREKSDRELLDKYEAAKKVVDKIKSLSADASDCACPTGDEIMQVKTAQRSITSLKNKLCGMNITAAINNFGGHNVEITSLLTNEKIDFSGDIAALTEAVKIVVPGIIEIQLSPADVDVTAVEKQISDLEKNISDIFTKYKVTSSDALENLAKTISEAKAEADTANKHLTLILGSVTYEDLEASAKAITTVIRPKEAIENDIFTVCGSADATSFITRAETIINGYTNEYGSINDLKATVYDLETDLRKKKESVSDTDDIPEEFRNIVDADAHLRRLKFRLDSAKQEREDALVKKTEVTRNLENFRENNEADPTETFEEAKRVFEEEKSLLRHWLHIREVFEAQKENIQNNPMQDIADSFTRYLGIISADRISSEFPEADKLNMQIYSGKNLLDYSKLSEGTKETVSLAFRLAVLDHLFPDGGGIIIFDDPFTDMDRERTAQACELIKECAKRHQVIFLTCKEEYLDMFAGNNIRF